MNSIFSILDKLARKLDEVLPEDLQKGKARVEKNVRVLAGSVFQRMDLVTRNEFDAQSEMLSQSQLRVKELEQRVQEIEGKGPK